MNINEPLEKEKEKTKVHLEEVQATMRDSASMHLTQEAPICRLCLQEKDHWGNFAQLTRSGNVQHRTCMAKYSKNRRALKKVIFKIKYQEYFGDVRPAGIVDREAMELKFGKKSKRESLKDRFKKEKKRQEICAHARKCKEEKRKKEIEEFNKTVEDFIKPAAVKITGLIEESQNREGS